MQKKCIPDYYSTKEEDIVRTRIKAKVLEKLTLCFLK